MQFGTASLKSEISGILERYEIPMDDRDLIIERIDSEMGNLAETVSREISRERSQVKERFDGFAREAKEALGATLERGQDAARRAYSLGYQEGLSQTKQGPGMLQIVIGAGLLGLAVFVVVREFLPKKK